MVADLVQAGVAGRPRVAVEARRLGGVEGQPGELVRLHEVALAHDAAGAILAGLDELLQPLHRAQVVGDHLQQQPQLLALLQTVLELAGRAGKLGEGAVDQGEHDAQQQQGDNQLQQRESLRPARPTAAAHTRSCDRFAARRPPASAAPAPACAR